MKTQYEVRGWIKNTEEDNWEKGCDPDSGSCFAGDDQFEANTVEELVNHLMQFAGTDDREAVTLDACEEAGRVDIQVIENADGYHASKPELEAFKKGKCRLWLADYTFQVEEVTREEVELS
jgi:hypothetical protein